MSSLRGLGKFRARPKREPADKVVQVSFRTSEPMRKYLGESSEAQGVSQEDFIVEAIEIDRDLARLLEGEDERLRAAALSMGVYLEEKMPEVLASLIKKGLDCQNIDCGQVKKKRQG